MNVDHIGISFLQELTQRKKRQKSNAQILVGWPFKRRKAIDAHLLFDPVTVARTIAWRDYPDLMTAFREIRSQLTRHGWYSANHRGVLICYNHDPHIYRFSSLLLIPLSLHPQQEPQELQPQVPPQLLRLSRRAAAQS